MKSHPILIRLLNLILAMFLGSLVLGQFGRYQFTPTSAIYVHDLFLICLYSTWLLTQPRFHQLISQPISKAVTIFSAAAIVSLLSAILSTHVFYASSALYLIRFLAYAGLTPVLIDAKERHFISFDLNRTLRVIGITLSVGGLMQYFLFPDTTSLVLLGWDDHYYRALGTLFDPNYLGLIVILTGLLVLYKQTAGKIITLITVFLTLLLTYSRASYISFIISVSSLAIIHRRWKIMIGAIIILALAISQLPNPGGEGANLLRTQSIIKRLSSQQTAVSVWLKHPFLGVGFNTYRYAAPATGKFSFAPIMPSAPDNSYLFILATTGMAGLLAFIYLAITIIRTFRAQPLVLASLVAVGTHAFFNNSLFYPWVMIWLGVLFAANPPREYTKH